MGSDRHWRPQGLGHAGNSWQDVQRHRLSQGHHDGRAIFRIVWVADNVMSGHSPPSDENGHTPPSDEIAIDIHHLAMRPRALRLGVVARKLR